MLRFNNCARWLMPLLVTVLAGCASAPPGQTVSARNADAADSGSPAVAEASVVEVPGDAQAGFDRALAAMRSGDVTEAELELEQLILEHPDFAGPRVNLAIIYMDSGRDAAARDALQKALALNPVHAEAHNQLGILLRRQGDFDAAEQAYADALAIAPDYALAHYNLGVLLDLYLKRPEEALPHYERYQTLAGEDERVKKWIIDLRRRLGIKEPKTPIAQEVIAQEVVTQEEAP